MCPAHYCAPPARRRILPSAARACRRRRERQYGGNSAASHDQPAMYLCHLRRWASLEDQGTHTIILQSAGTSHIRKFQMQSVAPAQLIAFEISEYAMYRLTEELSYAFPGLPVTPIVGDVKDTLLVDHVMQRYCPHI